MELNDKQMRLAQTHIDLRAARVNPIRRGGRRKAAALGMSMTQFWSLPVEDRQLLHQLSKRGRRT